MAKTAEQKIFGGSALIAGKGAFESVTLEKRYREEGEPTTEYIAAIAHFGNLGELMLNGIFRKRITADKKLVEWCYGSFVDELKKFKGATYAELPAKAEALKGKQVEITVENYLNYEMKPANKYIINLV